MTERTPTQEKYSEADSYFHQLNVIYEYKY